MVVPCSPAPRPEAAVEVSAPPAKRTRSSTTKSPGISFIAETQEPPSSSLSSFPSSQEQSAPAQTGIPPTAHIPPQSILHSPANEEASAEKAVRMLREALGLLENVDVEMEGMAEVEDEVFDAFTRLRRRRRSQGVATPGSVRSRRP